MCCCGQPNINGQYGYKWQPNDAPSIRQPYPPEIDEDETLLYDGPGRCGGLDAHSHHYRLTKWHGSTFLLVQHGGGKERIRLSVTEHFRDMVFLLDATQLYWFCHTLYHAYSVGKGEGARATHNYWQTAAMEKRIKVRKGRGTNSVTVRVEPKIVNLA
jgi:hypothetical protein